MEISKKTIITKSVQLPKEIIKHIEEKKAEYYYLTKSEFFANALQTLRSGIDWCFVLNTIKDNAETFGETEISISNNNLNKLSNLNIFGKRRSIVRICLAIGLLNYKEFREYNPPDTKKSKKITIEISSIYDNINKEDLLDYGIYMVEKILKDKNLIDKKSKLGQKTITYAILKEIVNDIESLNNKYMLWNTFSECNKIASLYFLQSAKYV